MRDKFSKTSKRYNLIGKRFGRLLVLDLQKIDKYRHLYYLCKCDCDNKTIVRADGLLSGTTKSCGCYKNEQRKEQCNKMHDINKKHGLYKHKLYKVWLSMKDRCYNKHGVPYKWYGFRGIKICDEWKNDFQAFYNWAINNGYQQGLSIDRINNERNYEPLNCRWATTKEQMNNTRKNCYITYNGETHTLSQWGKILNINNRTLRSRLCMNWSVERAFTTPVREYKLKERCNL